MVLRRRVQVGRRRCSDDPHTDSARRLALPAAPPIRPVPPDDDGPGPLSGQRRLGPLDLPDLVAAEVEAAARLRGVTPLEVVNELIAAWALRRRLPRGRRPG